MKIQILSGHSLCGGSTIAFINLCNLFNSKGLDCKFYGPENWPATKCNYDFLKNFRPNEQDTVILHYLGIPAKLKVRKSILSCHETNLFPIKAIKHKFWDVIHFVSQFQKEWQDVDGVVIPNVLTTLEKRMKSGAKIAGIIGSIDKNKRTHLSIERALNDGFKSIILCGFIGDMDYFNTKVLPYFKQYKDNISYIGIQKNMQAVYDAITHVYHSPELETYNMIKPECEAAGVIYCGLEGNDTKAEYWDNERIFEAWMSLLQ